MDLFGGDLSGIVCDQVLDIAEAVSTPDMRGGGRGDGAKELVGPELRVARGAPVAEGLGD